jgi:predicted negative regulator of RcsB-dependent stress response
MRAVAVIAILAALGLGGWNWWQIRGLQHDVSARSEDGRAVPAAAAKHLAEARDLIDRAQEGMAQAAARLDAGDTKGAHASLEMAMRNLDAAAELLKGDEESHGLLDRARKALADRLSKDKPKEETGEKSPKSRDHNGS